MKQKLRTIWNILTSKYHICFTYSDPVGQGGRIQLSGLCDKKLHRRDEKIADVLNCIDKWDYFAKEKGNP